MQKGLALLSLLISHQFALSQDLVRKTVSSGGITNLYANGVLGQTPVFTLTKDSITLVGGTQGGTVGIISNHRPNRVFYSLYPNPTASSIHILLPDEKRSKITIEILSLSGKRVLKEKLQMQQSGLLVNLKGLPKGTYIISIVGSRKHLYANQLFIKH